MSALDPVSGHLSVPTPSTTPSGHGNLSTEHDSSISRRSLLKTAAAAGAGLALAGSGLSTAEAAPPRRRPLSGKIQLDFWWPVAASDIGYAPGMASINAFNASQSKIEVHPQAIIWDQLHDKVITSGRAGSPPDITWALQEWVTEFYSLGLLMDLTSWVKAWPEHTMIYPQAWAAMTYGGKFVAVPQYLGIRAFEYHAKMFQKAGISRVPRTWKELQQTGVKVQKAVGYPVTAFGFCGQSVRAPQEIIVYLWQGGTDVVKAFPGGKFRNVWKERSQEMAAVVEMLRFYYDNVFAYQISPLDARDWDYLREDSNFAAGLEAMTVDGPWMSFYEKSYPQQMADVAIAPIPYNRMPATFLEVNSLVIYKNAKHPEAAFEFAKWVASKFGQKTEFPTQSVRRDVVPPGKWVRPFLALVPQGKFFPHLNTARIDQTLMDGVQKVLFKQGSPKDVAAWMADQINAAVRSLGLMAK